MPPKIRTNSDDEPKDGFRAIRYGLEGSLLSVAGVGVVSRFLGSDMLIDSAAAIIGFIAVVSFRHFVKISRS